MKLTILGFRSHCQSVYIFEDGRLHLVKGSSGAGKSTIFQAVNWCLYGNVKNVNHYLNPKSCVSVEIVKDNLTIVRKRNPKLLRCQFDQNVYEGDCAQGEINRLFGNPELWHCTSFCQQGEINPLLSGSSSSRLSILNTIAFPCGDDPRVITGKIADDLSKTEGETERLKADFERQLSEFNSFIKDEKIDLGLAEEGVEGKLREEQSQLNLKRGQLDRLLQQTTLQSSRREQLEGEMRELKKKMEEARACIDSLVSMKEERELLNAKKSDLTALLQETTVRSARLEQLEKNRNVLRKKLDDIPAIDEKTLNERKAQLQRFRKYQQLRQEVNKTVPPPLAGDPPARYSQSDLSIVSHRTYLYNSGLEQARSLGIPYDAKQIAERIKHLSDQIAVQPLYDAHENREKLLARRRELAAACSIVISRDALAAAEARLHNLHQSKDIISCPECGKGLRYHNSSLISARGESPYSEAEFIKLSDIVREGRERLEKQAEMTLIDRQLSSMNLPAIPPHLPRASIPHLTSQMNRLQKIVVIEKPEVDPSHVQEAISWWSLKDQHDKACNELEEFGKCDATDDAQIERDSSNFTRRFTLNEQYESITAQLSRIEPVSKKASEISREISDCDSALAKLTDTIALREQYDRIASQIKDLGPAGKSVAQIEQEISCCQARLQQLGEDIGSAKVSRLAKLRHEELTRLREKLLALQSRCFNLGRLKAIAVETQYKRLYDAVDNINRVIKDYIGDLFDIPVSLELSLTKTLSSTKQSKHQVNITIKMDGGEISDYRSCSGGEQERFNILLTLALHRISGSDLLIFDETFACLDLANKDACVNVISRAAQGSTVLVVNHEICEAAFDRIIDV